MHLFAVPSFLLSILCKQIYGWLKKRAIWHLFVIVWPNFIYIFLILAIISFLQQNLAKLNTFIGKRFWLMLFHVGKFWLQSLVLLCLCLCEHVFTAGVKFSGSWEWIPHVLLELPHLTCSHRLPHVQLQLAPLWPYVSVRITIATADYCCRNDWL